MKARVAIGQGGVRNARHPDRERTIALVALLVVVFVVLPIVSFFAYKAYYAAKGRGRRR